ncbi:MAG: hypothetical protein K1Y36_05200 [Blastocatellia bacterium]|nr:hypothetical protein [Blastocatellia bacterium]
MHSQKELILNHLDQQGWQVQQTNPFPLDWWAAEQLVLSSRWSPPGCQVFLTFLVDPQANLPTSVGANVWAVKASLQQPTAWGTEAGELTLALGRSWEQQLSTLIDFLNTCRLRQTAQGK